MKNQYSIFSRHLNSIRQWYRFDIIIVLPGILLFIHIVPFHLIPDYCQLREIENARSFIWSLLTLSVGFSGLIATILLVSFNFYIKTIRRQTVAYIAGNPWLKWLLSSFVGVLIMQVVGYVLMSKNQQSHHVTTLYILLLITLSYIFAIFPFVIRSLKYTNSLKHVEKLVFSLTFEDFQQISEPGFFLQDHKFEEIEGNALMLLKEISVSAVREGDWMLAQTIIADVYDWGKPLLSVSSIENNEQQFLYWLDGWLFITGHLKRVALLQHDHLAITSIYNHYLLLYEELNAHPTRLSAYRDIDNAFSELCWSAIGNTDLKELRKGMWRNYQKMLVEYAKCIKYTDQALPTFQFKRTAEYDPNMQVDQQAAQVWSWFVQTRMGYFFDWIDQCIKQEDELIVYGLQYGLADFLESLQWLENLTASQQNALLFQIFYRFQSTSLYSIKRKVDEGLMVKGTNVLRAIDLEDFGLVYDQLRYLQQALSLFLDRRSVSPFLFESVFSIFRELVSYEMDQRKKEDILSKFIEIAFELKQKATTEQMSAALFRMIRWLFEPVNTDPKLAALKAKFNAQYLSMIESDSY